jgi:hypothetical protein
MEEKKTFAEEALDMLQEHTQSEIVLFLNRFGELGIQVKDYSKDDVRIGARHIISHDVYSFSKANIDTLMTITLQHLRKELDSYGREQ